MALPAFFAFQDPNCPFVPINCLDVPIPLQPIESSFSGGT